MDVLLQGFVHRLILFLFGRWKMRCIEPPESQKETILNVNAEHRLLTVYCEEITMIKVYERWWMPNRTYRMFRLSAETDDPTASRLADAIVDKVHFPMLSFFPLGRRIQRSYMVSAYTDVLIARMKRSM